MSRQQVYSPHSKYNSIYTITSINFKLGTPARTVIGAEGVARVRPGNVHNLAVNAVVRSVANNLVVVLVHAVASAKNGRSMLSVPCPENESIRKKTH